MPHLYVMMFSLRSFWESHEGENTGSYKWSLGSRLYGAVSTHFNIYCTVCTCTEEYGGKDEEEQSRSTVAKHEPEGLDDTAS